MQMRAITGNDLSALSGFSLPRPTHVLEKDCTIIGAALVEGSKCRGFCVLEQWQGKGYGTYFLRSLLRSGVTEIVCEAANLYLHALCQSASLSPAHSHDSGQVSYMRSNALRLDAVWVAHNFLRGIVRAGASALDATAGNGHDTLFLAQLVGSGGKVMALDIQQQAIIATRQRLKAQGCADWVTAAVDSHGNLEQYAPANGWDAVMFNLGYLPGASHSLYTQPETSLPAMDKALSHLRAGGAFTACLYAGGEQGTKERDAALAFFRGLSQSQYTVAVTHFPSRGALYPIAVCIYKRG